MAENAKIWMSVLLSQLFTSTTNEHRSIACYLGERLSLYHLYYVVWYIRSDQIKLDICFLLKGITPAIPFLQFNRECRWIHLTSLLDHNSFMHSHVKRTEHNALSLSPYNKLQLEMTLKTSYFSSFPCMRNKAVLGIAPASV